MNLLQAKEIKKMKAILIKMAHEDPETLKQAIMALPEEDRNDLKYLVKIADEALTRAAINAANGLFS